MSLRTDRVGEAVREILAVELLQLKDPGLGFVSITDVRVTGDLRSATVYFSVLDPADSEAIANTEAALNRARIRLQSKIADRLHTKRTPRLRFEPDAGVLGGERLDALLRNLDDSESK